ncbi:hypothetical protein clem_14310 [Legionella clemsonensis]|uniref:Uncharacterized protein n=1 Tax=Legionella clemsonensis TaxID=1867846 RepID=A0A222P6B7_9GAMM|nr:hypothetical protein clem_14310 [Legionella clemsonensis]
MDKFNVRRQELDKLHAWILILIKAAYLPAIQADI